MTINNIIEKCFELSKSHNQINGFGYGPLYDLVGQEIEYPYLWVVNDDLHTMVVSDDGFNFVAVEYVFDLRVGDKVNNQPNVYKANGQNSNNGLEIISDTMSILIDLINGLTDDLSITDDIDIEPFFNEDTGNVNGHTATITLRVKNKTIC